MSARCTGMVFERYPVGGGEFTLALALADNAHDDGSHIFPSVATMAQKSRQDERSVQRHLKAMLASTWLLLVKPAGGRGRPAEYRINPRWLKGDNLSPIGEPAADAEKGDNVSPIRGAERVTSDAQKGDKQSTPYKNRRNQSPPNPPPGGEREGRIAPTRGEQPGTPGGFDAIAAAYPRRSRIEAAREVYAELAPDEQLHAEILRSIRAWKASAEWQREGGRFVPKLRDFLRDERWKDAPGADAPAVVVPVSQAPAMTPEQLRLNGQRARELVAKVKGLQPPERLAA